MLEGRETAARNKEPQPLALALAAKAAAARARKAEKYEQGEVAGKANKATLEEKREKKRQLSIDMQAQSLILNREKRERKEKVFGYHPAQESKPREKQSPKPGIIRLDSFGQPKRGPGRPPDKWKQQQLLQRRFSTPALKTQPSGLGAINRRSSSFGFVISSSTFIFFFFSFSWLMFCLLFVRL